MRPGIIKKKEIECVMVPQGRRQQDAAGAPYRVMRRSLSILKRSSDWLHLHIKLKNKDVFGLLTKTLNCPCSPHVQTFKKIKKKKRIRLVRNILF